MQKKKKKSIKKASRLVERALSLDEVFRQVAETTVSTLTPEVTRTILTPLSAEACLRHGVNPEVLRERDLDSFWEPNIDEEVQRMRHEAYARRRVDLMNTVTEERNKLATSSSTPCKDNKRDGDGSSVSLPADAIDQQEAATSTLLEMEHRRLLKVKDRQKKELLQMLQFEAKRDEITNDMKAKAERDARREEQRKREKLKKERRAAEERRMKELRRKAQEDAEEEMARLAQTERFERERKIQKDRERQEKENRARAKLMEEERARKQEAQRLQTQQFLEQQKLETERRLKEREIREHERQEKIALKRRMDKEEFEAKRKEAAHRIEANRAAAKEREENRKYILMEKQRHHEKIQHQIMEEQQRHRELKQKQSKFLEHNRAYQLKITRDRQEAAKESLLKKFEDDEHHLAELREMRKKDHALVKEERELKDQLKKDNVERIKRIQEYHQLETMRKVSDNDRRTEQLLRKKQELVDQRRRAAHQAKIEKDRIMSVLEKSKAGGGSSIKKLLASLSEEGTGTKKKKRKKKTGGTLLSRTKSAPGCMVGPPIQPMQPPPDAPSLYVRLRTGAEQPAVESYKSPYLSEPSPSVASDGAMTM